MNDVLEAAAKGICMELYGGYFVDAAEREAWPQWHNAIRAARACLAAAAQNDEVEIEVWQSDEMVATVSASSRAKAVSEAMHYGAVYLRAGPVSFCEVVRFGLDLPVSS